MFILKFLYFPASPAIAMRINNTSLYAKQIAKLYVIIYSMQVVVLAKHNALIIVAILAYCVREKVAQDRQDGGE
jgi:hypothetical protein